MVWVTRTIGLLAMLCATACTHAQVTGPSTAQPGELVVLESSAESQWIAIEPVDLIYRQFETGRALAFSTGLKSGRIIVLCVAWDTRRIDRHIVTIGTGPKPDPEPNPDPNPDPTPPQPSKLWTIIVEESLEAAANRGSLYGSMVLQEYLRSKGHRWRVYDDDAKDAAGNVPADAARWIAKAGTGPRPILFLVTNKGEIRYTGAVPADAQAFIELVKKYGG